MHSYMNAVVAYGTKYVSNALKGLRFILDIEFMLWSRNVNKQENM